MNLKVTKQTESGLNVEFINTESGRHIPLPQAIQQIKKGNPNYDNYTTVTNKNGVEFIRSKPDNNRINNIE